MIAGDAENRYDGVGSFFDTLRRALNCRRLFRRAGRPNSSCKNNVFHNSVFTKPASELEAIVSEASCVSLKKAER
jgi:hypothetical protein